MPRKVTNYKKPKTFTVELSLFPKLENLSLTVNVSSYVNDFLAKLVKVEEKDGIKGIKQFMLDVENL